MRSLVLSTSLLIAAALLLAAPPASGALLRPLSLPALVAKADRIVVIEVEQALSAWEGRRIYTHTRVTVQEVLKGKGLQPGDELTVRQLGGRVEDREMVVPGTPRLVPGGRYLVFLDRDERGAPYHYVVGMAQGVYRMDAGAKTATRPDTGDVSYVAGKAPAAGHLDLDQVRALIAAEQGR